MGAGRSSTGVQGQRSRTYRHPETDFAPAAAQETGNGQLSRRGGEQPPPLRQQSSALRDKGT